MDRVLAQKVAPVMATIQRLQRNSERPGVTEVIGGLGYIAGLFGLIIYLKSRRKDT